MNILRKILLHPILKRMGEEGPKRYFFHTGWNLTGRVVGLIVGFFVNIYVIRVLGPYNFGLVSYVLSYVGLFAFLASLGVDSILYVDLIESPEKKDKLLGTSFILKIVGSILVCIILLISVSFNNNGFYVNLLILLFGISFIFSPFSVINTYFLSKVFSKPIVINSIVVNIILACLKVLVVFLHLNLVYFIIILACESLFYSIGYLFIYRKYKFNIFKWKFDKNIAQQILYNSWPLILSGAFVQIYMRIDQVFIKHMVSIESVGLYGAAVKLSEIWYFLPVVVVGSLFPAVLNARKVGITKYIHRLSRLYSLAIYLSILFIIPIFFLSEQIVVILYGTAYLGAVSSLKIYIWAGVSVAISSVLTQALIGEKRTKMTLLISLIGMTLNVILNIYFIPKYGIEGAAWTTLISYSISPFAILLFKNTRNHFFYMCRGLLFR